ncbi:MAG: hypothetical protein ABR499_19845 [Gemmatimonadaceae bacterium]
MPTPNTTTHLARATAVSLLALLGAGGAAAQEPVRPDSARAAQQVGAEKKSRPRRPAPLFSSTAPIELTLTVNMRRIMGDRDTTKREHPYRATTLAYRDSAGAPVTLPAQVRVRGVWRLQNCQFPPLRFRIAKEAANGTLFDRARSPKLVTHCRNSDDYEQYVLHEYAIYRMQALVTPVALHARLARMTYVDSASGKPVATRAAILLEDEDNLAERLGGRVFEVKGVPQRQLEPYDTFVMALFQFMIGNTDWSVPGLHNIQIIQTDSALTPRHFALAFDWDFTGLVRARYAGPSPQLRIRTVRDRLYRGLCPSESDLARAIALFNEKRTAILAVYDDVPGLDPRVARDGREYLEDFFRIINDPRRVRREIIGDCDQR